MIGAVYNMQTGKTTFEKNEDIEMPTESIVAEPTESERLKALENALLEVL